MKTERKQTTIYLSKDERELLEKLATMRGLSATAFMRMLLIDKAAELSDQVIIPTPKKRQPEYV